MNDTPRTDSETYTNPAAGYEIVNASFARELELELAEATEEIVRMAKRYRRYKDERDAALAKLNGDETRGIPPINQGCSECGSLVIPAFSGSKCINGHPQTTSA